MIGADGITRYDLMPLPAIEAQTELVAVGDVVFGVEYRLLDEAIAAAGEKVAAAGDAAAGRVADDRGVAIHVYGVHDGERLEHLRFDCFDEDPHYHYVSWADRTNEMIHLDPVAVGDPLAWALERIRTRLPQMLARAGARTLAERIDRAAIEDAMPRLAEAAYRARFHHDEAAVRAGALRGGRPSPSTLSEKETR